MCGIIGYCGQRPAVSVLMNGLERLEYRGYDSSGLALVEERHIQVVRSCGKLETLRKKLENRNCGQAMSGIAHTRWATHGLPTLENAHPHSDQSGRIFLVHNGIIENYQVERERLLAAGHQFSSQTDSEVLAHLVGEEYEKTQDMRVALSAVIQKVSGAYALVAVCQDFPGRLFAVRSSCPLLIGKGQEENFVASDIPAFLAYTRDVIYLDDKEIVEMDSHEVRIFAPDSLSVVAKKEHRIKWDIQAAQKDGFKHFMLKEIFEQPQVIRNCLSGRLNAREKEVILPELEKLALPRRLVIIGCGTSFHAGLWARYLLERWAEIPVQVEIASEFRYRNFLFQPGDLVLAVSQSGETADTLAAVRLAKEKKVPVLGLCNVVGSSIARESDAVVYTQAGPEISVASTKAMCSQQVMLLLFALYWAKAQGILTDEIKRCFEELSSLPDALSRHLPAIQEQAKKLCRFFSTSQSFFYLGRGIYFPLALEGALKLKELSYIHAEGYAAGEMKHGPIALVDASFPTFIIALDDDLLAKVQSNLEEILCRDGQAIVLTNTDLQLKNTHCFQLPSFFGPLNTFSVLSAFQFFAYEMADYLGKDVDQPRNLAKSVTVE